MNCKFCQTSMDNLPCSNEFYSGREETNYRWCPNCGTLVSWLDDQKIENAVWEQPKAFQISSSE